MIERVARLLVKNKAAHFQHTVDSSGQSKKKLTAGDTESRYPSQQEQTMLQTLVDWQMEDQQRGREGSIKLSEPWWPDDTDFFGPS